MSENCVVCDNSNCSSGSRYGQSLFRFPVTQEETALPSGVLMTSTFILHDVCLTTSSPFDMLLLLSIYLFRVCVIIPNLLEFIVMTIQFSVPTVKQVLTVL